MRVAQEPQLESRMQRLAAIDVGTNSLRLIIAEASSDGSYRVIDDEKEVTRLGQGLAMTGNISPESIEASADAIARMRNIAEGYGVTALRVVGTCAVREAQNADEFIELVRERAGLDVEVISAEEEAKLAYFSVRKAFDLRLMDAAIVDIGGGSTEIVITTGGSGAVQQIHTLPLGAVRLTEQFIAGSTGQQDKRVKLMRRSIRDTLRAQIGKLGVEPQVMYGTGGTFTALANISYHRHNVASGTPPAETTRPFTVRGYEMNRREVREIYFWLNTMPVRARARIVGLSPDRAEIILAGAAIVERLMRHLRVNKLRVHDRGIRDGLILTMIGEAFPQAPVFEGPPDRKELVEQLAIACKDDRRHSEHVTGLAMQIFDQLVEQFEAEGELWATPETRELLWVAANLHDIGYSINYARHHKHSYHLIIHSELGGYTHRDIEVIANVARYHRRADPKMKHPAYAKLTKEDRMIVRRLSAILRIADGLDRAHSQFVKRVAVDVHNVTTWFIVYADAEPVVDLWGAARKSELFHKAFGVDSRFEWGGADVDEPPSCKRSTSSKRSQSPHTQS